MPTRYPATILSLAATLAAGLWGTGCDSDGGDPRDGAPDLMQYPPTDATAADTLPSVLTVDFTVSDCPQLDLSTTAGAPRCTGHAPVTVKFIPISSSGINKYLWDFGDATAKSSERTPSHTYALPGAYDVTLVGAGASGTVSKPRTSFVVVTPNALGEPCDVDAQCQQGMGCVCGSAAKCPSSFARGICSASCRDTACGAGASCADLTLGAAKPEPWQQPLCLKACDKDQDCGSSLRCRDLPGRPAAAGWTRACFASTPGDLGASCRSASGVLRNDQCITNFCANLGANGLCTLVCGGAAKCPASTVCAELKNGQSLCLRPCGPTMACDGDPMLACEAPGNAGPLGFRVPAGTTPAMYCAPKHCNIANDCGPAGQCQENGEGGHCARK